MVTERSGEAALSPLAHQLPEGGWSRRQEESLDTFVSLLIL